MIINRIPRAWVPTGIEWTKEYNGGALPDAGGDNDWTKLGTQAASVAAGILHLDDDAVDDRIAYIQDPTAFNNVTGWTAEFSIKVVSYSADGANRFRIFDNTYYLTLELQTDRIYIRDNDTVTYMVDLTDTQHIVRVTGEGVSYKVYVDGSIEIDGTLSDENAVNNSVLFGCSNEVATGEAYWDFVNYYNGGAVAP